MRLIESFPVEQVTNQKPFDRFTLGHFGFGLMMGAVKLTLPGILITAIGWELLERPFKVMTPKLFPVPRQDSFANASVDALSMIAGWYVNKLYQRYTKE